MKKIQKKLTPLVLAVFTSLGSFAQEKSAEVDINVTETSKTWYAQPWMWVVGAAVFILILVALLRGGKKA